VALPSITELDAPLLSVTTVDGELAVAAGLAAAAAALPIVPNLLVLAG
jgi:hypothetical protein